MSENQTRKHRQTLQIGLIAVMKKLFPDDDFKILYSILDGIYCELSGSLVSDREVRLIEKTLRQWVQNKSTVGLTEKDNGFYKYRTDDTIVDTIYPAFADSSAAGHFSLIHFPPGFILHFCEEDDSTGSFALPEKLSATYAETQRWLEHLHLSRVSDVNSFILNGGSIELISIAEALHEKKIADIADMILKEKKNVRIVLISGPSSSGKTTFTQRLSTQLRVNGLKPLPLSLDDYFVNREDTPRDASGQFDFDTLEALDLSYLNRQIAQLLRGEAVEVPIFDFVSGMRLPEGRPLRLHEDEILLIEGIHALNPHLLTSVNRNTFFKIYISALFQLNINAYNRVPTTEARLIRRIIRDERYRSFKPERTLQQWASVRRGENTSVFKYQEEADVMFNSSLLYELNALRSFAEPLLENVPKDDPHYNAVTRLLNLLSFFEPMDVQKIPFNSILREFIGGSIYTGE